MRVYCIIATACLLAGCVSAPNVSVHERSDRQKQVANQQPTKSPVNIPGWTPGGKGDTDGKPGEPNCPDCDGGGPVYHGSVRPSR